MSWQQSPAQSVSSLGRFAYTLPSPVGVSNIGITIAGQGANPYRRMGYLWALAGITGTGFAYATQIDGGPIWGVSYRYQLFPASIISQLYFAPSQQLIFPASVRFLWFLA